MLGSVLDGSTGPPDYNATFSVTSTWIFQAQYFFMLNATDGSGELPKAAVGETFACEAGETLFTAFSVAEGFAGPEWTLSMGVVGDATRVSSVRAPQPFMGLLNDETQSWGEAAYDHVQRVQSNVQMGAADSLPVLRTRRPYSPALSLIAASHLHASFSVNGCWELYSVDTPSAFPSTGSDVMWTTTTYAPNSIPWFRNWTNIEVPTCDGAPKAIFSDSVSPTSQQVDWTIYY